ncbi:hypothetical protein BU26DRAFT_513107 [Trematosphaeria pertusa]|uniref:Pentacotripeptide-repeat region of PRORP domain-containing protein n=1 Tax=Trematosphaeria pertusa TaxID=390896 RepID=A0A6A6J0L5_9PLEO|nr:uncharacterized protein BU26DRAFT_513107 [Trematosphaeria pertusa]KAF2256274.1 hypothetical protein BU26DRAFT_513107 [Trematosphaeria pertusa]
MPRACLPNARCFTSAELPVLPFLAPRVFAESPFPRASSQRDVGTTQEKQEEKNRDSKTSWNVKRSSRSDGREIYWSRGSGAAASCSTFGNPGNTANLSRIPCSSISLRSASSTHTAQMFLGLRYADIFSFTRHQMRSYSSKGLEVGSWMAANDDPVEIQPHDKEELKSNMRRVESDGHTVVRTEESESTFRKVASEHRAARRKRAPRTIIHCADSGALLTARRKKALLSHRKRMSNLLSYEVTTEWKSLMRQGRYRSLRRRIFLFSRNRPAVVNLNLRGAGPTTYRLLTKAFGALDRRVYPCARRQAHKLRLQHHPKCIQYATLLFDNVGPPGDEQMWRNWMDFDENSRETWWPALLLYALDRVPSHALSFIQALEHEPCVKNLQPEILADALGHLARIHAGNIYGKNEHFSWSKENLVPTFFHIFRGHFARHPKVCSQDLLMNIARLANAADLKRIFDLLVESKTYLIHDTILHYANAFAEAGEHEYALLCLKAIAERTANPVARHTIVNRERFRWTCALILRKSMSVSRKYHETTGIVAAFVKLGVKLDILLYNVIMHNAMEAGDYSTAFRVYNTLEENGLKPDKHTFSILLYGCTMTNNPAMFHDFAEYCANAATELKDPWLAADYLYYLYVCDRRNDDASQQDSTKILQAYRRFFSAEPLEPFWTGLPTRQAPEAQDHATIDLAPMEPPPVALYIMLQTEIRNALTMRSTRVWRLYLKFRRLVRENHHPVLNELARNPVIWNAFLLAFCEKQQFASASALINHMSDNSPHPNVYSWNIFMQAFFKSSQVQAAERVFEIMRARGVEPDQFTYGVLLRGYAKAQHVEKIGETMEHVDNEQQLDPKLLQALARVHLRQRLMLALERSRLRKERKERENAETEAERRRERWKAPAFTPLFSPKPSASDAGGDPNRTPTFASVLRPALSSRTKEKEALLTDVRPVPWRKVDSGISEEEYQKLKERDADPLLSWSEPASLPGENVDSKSPLVPEDFPLSDFGHFGQDSGFKSVRRQDEEPLIKR